MMCPKCNSENVKVRREKTGEVQGTYTKKKKHGAVWWICVGWWLVLLDICTLGIAHLFIKKKGTRGTASLWHTVAVCQDCGYTWETADK